MIKSCTQQRNQINPCFDSSACQFLILSILLIQAKTSGENNYVFFSGMKRYRTNSRQIRPGRLGPAVRFSEADRWAPDSWESRFLSISKICVQFNIVDSILIFVPNIWGSYQVWLLSLVPVRSWGGGHTFCTIVQFNILDSILIFVPKTQLSALENRQLGSNICPGPNCPGPNWAFH